MTPDQMTELAARLKRLSSDYAFMNAYPGAARAMVNAADLIAGMAQRVPLSDADIASACYSYRHDFGLLPPDEQVALIREAREWARCFGIRSEK